MQSRPRSASSSARFLAYAAASIRRPKWLRSLVTAFSGVAANLGGIPLAFAFIALLGRQGLGTKILDGLGCDLYGNGFQLDTTTGFVCGLLVLQHPADGAHHAAGDRRAEDRVA